MAKENILDISLKRRIHNKFYSLSLMGDVRLHNTFGKATRYFVYVVLLIDPIVGIFRPLQLRATSLFTKCKIIPDKRASLHVIHNIEFQNYSLYF